MLRKEALLMDSKIMLLIYKNKAKLSKMIEQNAPYDKILRQSRKLDKYIIIAMKCINEKRR